MRNSSAPSSGVGLALTLLPLLYFCSAPQKAPDMIVVNADIRTADPDQPIVEAVAIRDGRFIHVGPTSEIRSLAGPETEVIDAGRSTVLPGLIDGHTHLGSGGSLVNGVDLYGIGDRATWLQRIQERSAQLEEGDWLTGGRWDHTLTGGELPTRQELDSVVPDRPVALRDIDGHSLWVNTKALELAGISAASEVPEGGEIVLDARTGQPTGILLEGAGRLISGAAGLRRTPEQRREDVRETIRFFNSKGITSIHDMSGSDVFDVYLGLLESDDLTLRVWFGVRPDGSMEDAERYAEKRRETRERVRRPSSGERGPLLDLAYFKLTIDGVLSTHTAAMIEPYSDRPEVSGAPFRTQEKIDDFVKAGHANGFPVAIHAIGDKAVRMALNAFEQSSGSSGFRDRIEHIEVVHPTDLLRFSQLDVAASMQPNHATGTIGKYITQRIGREREAHAYVWNDFLKSGAHLVFGSDWPTSPLSPLAHIADAVFRESPTGLLEGPWYPENAVSFDEALYAYTQAGARMTGWASEIGSIEVGKWADFVVLDGRLSRPLDRSIKDRTVEATYLGGRAVYP